MVNGTITKVRGVRWFLHREAGGGGQSGQFHWVVVGGPGGSMEGLEGGVVGCRCFNAEAGGLDLGGR